MACPNPSPASLLGALRYACSCHTPEVFTNTYTAPALMAELSAGSASVPSPAPDSPLAPTTNVVPSAEAATAVPKKSAVPLLDALKYVHGPRSISSASPPVPAPPEADPPLPTLPPAPATTSSSSWSSSRLFPQLVSMLSASTRQDDRSKLRRIMVASGAWVARVWPKEMRLEADLQCGLRVLVRRETLVPP